MLFITNFLWIYCMKEIHLILIHFSKQMKKRLRPVDQLKFHHFQSKTWSPPIVSGQLTLRTCTAVVYTTARVVGWKRLMTVFPRNPKEMDVNFDSIA